MATFFLIIIYIAFISLGLPDSLLGAAWPVMRFDLSASLDAAGAVSLIITAGTILSSLLSDRMIKRFGTGRVTAFSVLATATALLGFSFSQSLVWLMILAVPLGLGAGAVDAALNNYVALHYSARHMSWLHCFWGVGAFMGPVIIASFLASRGSWRGGYLTISIIQFAVTALLFITLPMWVKREARGSSSHPDESPGADKPEIQGRLGALTLPGVVPALLTFLCLCAIELSFGLWSSSFLTEARGLTAEAAAAGPALFYFSITAGRFISGLLADRISAKMQIRIGGILMVVGVFLYVLPLPIEITFVAIAITGFGSAPVYPCMVHETPRRFGKVNSQKLIGLQMAAAYTGTTIVPPLVGLLADKVSIWAIPVLMVPLAVLLLLLSERIESAVKKTLSH